MFQVILTYADGLTKGRDSLSQEMIYCDEIKNNEQVNQVFLKREGELIETISAHRFIKAEIIYVTEAIKG